MSRASVRFLLVATLVPLIALAVVGCSKQNSIVGSWQPASGSGFTWQFTTDGKLIQQLPASTETTAGSWQNVTNTYTLSGNILTIVPPSTSGKTSQPATMSLTWVSAD